MVDGNTEQVRLIVAESVKQAIAQTENKGSHKLDLSTTEKTIVAIITAVVIAMLGWTVNTTNDTATRVAVIESQLAEVRAAYGDRYTESMGRQHESQMERRISRLEAAHAPE